MRNLKRRFERFTAIALAVLMVVTTVDLSTFAVSAAGEGSGTYCEHHTEHTPECGYTEGIEGSPCTHEHGEECYSEVTVCVHGHDESCGYVEGVEDSCTHICSLENGCIISALNCTHEHDEECGYQAAVEGTPCIYECEECANASNDGSDTVSGNEVSDETTECTCETDDPAFHATNCPAYIAPENPQCYCAEKCTEDTLNIWCDVCCKQGVSACQGEDTAVTYDAETPVFSDAQVLTADEEGVLCIDGVAITDRIMPAGNYKLESDITTNIHVFTEGSINIDLNGHTWNMSDKNLRIDEGVTLSLYDTSGLETGKITSSYDMTVYGVGSGTTFNLYSGTVENTYDEANGKVVFASYGIINLYGGTIKSNAYAVLYYLHRDITINIDNTSFDCGDGHAQFFASFSSYSEPCAVIDVSDYEGGTLTVDAIINKAGKMKIFTGIQSAQDADNYKINFSCDANKDFFEEKQEYEEDGGNKYVYVSVPSFTTQPTEGNDYTVAFNHPNATLQWCEVTVYDSATYSEEDGDHDKSYEVNAGDTLIVSLSECLDDFDVVIGCIYNEESLSMFLDSSRKTASVTFDSACSVNVNVMLSPYGTGEYKIEHVRCTELEGENGVQLSKTECETTYVCKATVGGREYYSDKVTIEHSCTCTATSDNVITKECANCGKSGTLTITAEGGIYDGTTAYGATVEKTGILENEDVTVNYYQGNTLIGTNAPVNVGTYTAKITYEDVTVYDEVTIAKGTPDIGTVSASNMENTLDVSQVALSRSKETVPGTLSLADGTTLQYGIHDYTYVFTPNDNTNYETVTGTVSITISDTISPTATYKVGTDEWKQFINTITFGHFCKDYTTVDITYSDEGSGVADKQYYISNEEITNTENIQWSEYTDTLNINATGKYYIYVRVTDNYGNVVIQNSEGIAVYAESVIAPTSFSCEYGEENALYVTISTNGNTFANLTDGSGNEIDTENYSYSIDRNELTIKGEYLSDLDVGTYTYKICMNPQGVENTEVTLAYSFVVNVTAKELTVTGATATSRDYIANDKTVDITGVTLSGKLETDDVSVEITGLKGTLRSANAGTYTSVTLPTLTLPTFTLTGYDAKNYVLVQPTSAVATNVTINKLNPTITVDETEYYKTFGDADFTLDITDDNPEANVTYSSNDEDEDVVAVSNGTVSIKGAGSATITVSMGASTNYNAAVDKTVTVNVARATYSVDTINKSYLYARSNADSINLAELLPEDCGTVNYASVTYNGALTFTSEDTKPKVTNGILAYTLESGAADDTGNIIVDVKTQNYEDITITVNVTLIDQIPVNVDGEVELNSNVLTYGETLSGLTFKSVDFVDNAGNEVAGTLAWKEPSATPNAGTTSATWVFTPNNAEYASVEGTVAITVNKATPNVTGVPTVADRVYNPSVVLADSVLTGGTVKGVDGNSLAGSWSWQTTNVVPVVNNSGYIAVFTPTDSTNYETVTRTITVNVTKATPYVATKPTASALTYGQTLNQSVLSNGVIHYSETDSTVVAGSFAWEAGTVKPAVSDSATTLYNVLFTPDDSDNYKEVTVILTVSVSKAEATALNNANKTYVYAESKNGESVSIEGLPEDCGSVSYEISSISDTNNMLENVSVDATGKLTYDVKSLNAYSNGLSATVTVTVSMQNYEDLTYTLTVVRTDKLVQNISAENISLTFGDNDTDIVVTGNKTELSYRIVDDSNENGDVVTVDSTGKVHIVNSGTATVEIKAEGSSSYAEAICEIQVTVAKRTVNVPAKDDTVYTYTGLPQTYSIASSPFYTIENTTQTNAGTYDVAVSLISDNYQWSAVLPEYKFVINPAQVTITAESHTVKQGDELPAFTYITTGLVNGENLPITVSVTCSATNSETVGTYDIVVSGPANEGNYTYVYTNGVLEVLAEDEAPFIMGDDGKMGWDAISDEIEDANKGDTIVVDMNGATVVPGDIIEEARDKGITISFVLDNGLTWTIDGSTVSDGEIGNINFDTTVEDENNPLNNIPVDVINGVTGEKATIEVNLTYSGNFGFTAVLKANLGSDNAGYYANLYYYNPTTGKLEYMCADVIASNGEAELTFTHASDYLIVIDDEDLGKAPDDDDDDDDGDDNDDDNTTEDKDDGKDEVPDTGDAGTLYLWIIMICAALGMLGVTGVEKLDKRRKNR